MPIHDCEKDGKPGYQWGGGTCYTHDGSEEGKQRARHQAEEQAAAAYASGYEGNSMRSGVQHKQFTGGVTKALIVGDDMLARINKQTPQPVTADQVYAATMDLANTTVDRAFERFPQSYLQRFAETIPGKSVLGGHDYDSRPIGRFFGASVEPDGDGGAVLKAEFYTGAGGTLAEDIQLGIAKDVSIGFLPDELSCDLCSKSYYGKANAAGEMEVCSHWAGEMYDGKTCTLTYGGDLQKVEAVEGSFVWLGCQYGAQVTGAGSPQYARKAALLAAPQKGSAEDVEMKEALAEIERLKPLAAAGEKYLTHLKTEAARKSKALNLGAAGDMFAAMSANANLEQLEELNSKLDEQMQKAYNPRPGANVQQDDTQQATARTSPLQSRLLAGRS